MLINEHFFIDCLNLGNWKISVTAWIKYLSIWNSVDRAEQKSSQKIDIPCLHSVKQTQRTLSNPVKYLHSIVPNNKGFEISSPRCRCRGELGHAWGGSRGLLWRSPHGCQALPGLLAQPGTSCWHCLAHPAGTACWHSLLEPSPAHPKGSIPWGTASALPLCHVQNSQTLARRSQAILVMGQLSRVFKINQNPGSWEKWASHAVNCVNGQLRDGHRN